MYCQVSHLQLGTRSAPHWPCHHRQEGGAFSLLLPPVRHISLHHGGTEVSLRPLHALCNTTVHLFGCRAGFQGQWLQHTSPRSPESSTVTGILSKIKKQLQGWHTLRIHLLLPKLNSQAQNLCTVRCVRHWSLFITASETSMPTQCHSRLRTCPHLS